MGHSVDYVRRHYNLSPLTYAQVEAWWEYPYKMKPPHPPTGRKYGGHGAQVVVQWCVWQDYQRERVLHDE